MSGFGEMGGLVAASVSIVVVGDLGAISSVSRDGGRDQRVIRSGR